MSGNLVVGVPFIVGGCLSSALGLALMKYSSAADDVPFYLNIYWLCGFLCLAVLQTACDSLSLSFLPLSVVAPFAGLTIVFSLLFASSGWLGVPEALGLPDIMGAVAVLVGVTCVSLGAPHSGTEPNLEQLASSLMDASIAVPLVATAAGAAACLFAPVFRSRCHVALTACGAASCGAISQLSLKLVSLSVRDRLEHAEPGAWMLHPVGIGGACGLALAAPAQLTLLNVALASSRASLIVPIYQAALVSLTTLAGGAAFHEFASMRALEAGLYMIGLVSATTGLVVLSRGEQDDGEPPSPPEPSAVDAFCSPTRPVSQSNTAPLLVETASLDMLLGGATPSPMPATGASDPSSNRGMLHRRRSSVARLPAPMLLGVAAAVIETRDLTSKSLRGRAKSFNVRPPPTFGSGDARKSQTVGGRMRSQSTIA